MAIRLQSRFEADSSVTAERHEFVIPSAGTRTSALGHDCELWRHVPRSVLAAKRGRIRYRCSISMQRGPPNHQAPCVVGAVEAVATRLPRRRIATSLTLLPQMTAGRCSRRGVSFCFREIKLDIPVSCRPSRPERPDGHRLATDARGMAVLSRVRVTPPSRASAQGAANDGNAEEG
jgi:hypothetical protein